MNYPRPDRASSDQTTEANALSSQGRPHRPDADTSNQTGFQALKTGLERAKLQIVDYIRSIIAIGAFACLIGVVTKVSGISAAEARQMYGMAVFIVIAINAVAVTTAIVRYVWTGRAEVMNDFEDRIRGRPHNDPLIMIGLKSVVFLAIVYLIIQPV